MLLDIYALKAGLESLPTLASPAKPPPPPPASYTKRVTQALSRIDPILKTLQVRPSPPEALVQAYLIHVSDKSDANFRKLLDLKGIKRAADQAHLLELFQAHRASPRHADLPSASPTLTAMTVGGTVSGVTGVGAGGSLSGTSNTPQFSAALPTTLGSLTAASLSSSHLPTRFDPSTLGNAIMTAARDGVDRIGNSTGTSVSNPTSSSSPAPTTDSTIPSLTSSTTSTTTNPFSRQALSPDSSAGPLAAAAGPGPAVVAIDRPTGPAGNLNENLRNIGKFFRRDVAAGFGGRFGGGGASGSSSGSGAGGRGSMDA